jgi:hypothetical protein
MKSVKTNNLLFKLTYYILWFSALEAEGAIRLPVKNSAAPFQRSGIRDLQVAVISWNLAETTPFINDCGFLSKFANCDIIAIGVQVTKLLCPREPSSQCLYLR